MSAHTTELATLAADWSVGAGVSGCDKLFIVLGMTVARNRNVQRVRRVEYNSFDDDYNTVSSSSS